MLNFLSVLVPKITVFSEFVEFRDTDGVCSTDLRLDTSTNGLKQVYTSPEEI
jgi:hypothetical protein